MLRSKLSSTIFAGACSAILLFGCSSPSAPPAPKDDAAAFLKWSMDRYADLGSLKYECEWTAKVDGAPKQPDPMTREFSYAKPNKFRALAKLKGFDLTSVSDGQSLSEWATRPGVQGVKSPAPEKLADAKSLVLRNPTMNGSLIYGFFGGSADYGRIVDAAKEAPSFGPDETVDGEACRTIKFQAAGLWGTTTAVIGTKDGLIRRMTYGNEPLLERMKQAGSAQTPKSFVITENYRGLSINPSLAATVFAANPPEGVSLADNTQRNEPQPPVPVGTAAPGFTLTGLNGGKVSLDSLKGKVVMMDFWATWCGPCRKSLPETQKLHEQFGSKDLAILAISGEDAPTIKKYVDENKYTFPTFVDDGNRVNETYKVEVLPTVIILDKEGKLSSFLLGLRQPEEIMDALRKAGLQG